MKLDLTTDETLVLLAIFDEWENEGGSGADEDKLVAKLRRRVPWSVCTELGRFEAMGRTRDEA